MIVAVIKLSDKVPETLIAVKTNKFEGCHSSALQPCVVAIAEWQSSTHESH